MARATGPDGRLVATSIADVRRDLRVILGGIFYTRKHTRRPYLPPALRRASTRPNGFLPDEATNNTNDCK